MSLTLGRSLQFSKTTRSERKRRLVDRSYNPQSALGRSWKKLSINKNYPYKMPAKSSSASVRSTMKCLLVVLCSLAASWGASIPRGIPVEVVYDEPHKGSEAPGVRNLAEKMQLPLKELAPIKEENIEKIEDKSKPIGNPNGIKNLEEMNQLSQEERNQVLKHLPNEIVKDENPLGNLMILKRAEEMINEGLHSLKMSADKVSSIVTPNEESWKQLNKSVQQFFLEQYRVTGLKDDIKQDQPGGGQGNQIIQSIISGFQNFTGNFIQSFQQSNQANANGTEDEGTGAPGLAQNFINAFNGGVQQIISNVQNIGGGQSSTSSTVLGDTGTGSTTQSTNLISNVINSFQQIFSGGGNTGSPSQVSGGNQSDTGESPSTSAPNIIQGAINQFNQVVSNFRPTVPTPPPGSQGDEPTSTTQRGPVQIIQTIGNQIGSAFSNAFGQGTTNKPPEDEGTGSSQAPGGNFFQNVGQAIQNVIRPQGSTQAPGSPAGGSNNPIIAGAQAVGTQVQQLVEGQASGNNPIESVQNAIAGAISSTESSKIPEKVEQEKPVAEEQPAEKLTSKPSLANESLSEKKDEIMQTTE